MNPWAQPAVKPAWQAKAIDTEAINPQNVSHAQARAKNPWGLTPGEGSILTEQRRRGSYKATAAALGLSSETVRVHIYNAKKKMGLATGLLAVCEWDQFMRSQDV